ncbi:hypothetical protein EYF80_023601 [Liparis tanakae]|uniref:Uncharacterized protein n=1 Tax=Liparis tanakae TaxID=230148 RepID=A0A4Z2HMB6_9TELE|nr:hypothetical protein EYF80_023601 [Liparis tanakae]
MLYAIRQVENSHELLEKTVLKLRVDQKERHMQRIGNLLQASMFLNYMWQKMRVAGAPSSMSQDEDMDTTALAQPFFMMEKEKGMESGDEEKQDGDDSDDGQGEDPNGPEKEEEDDEVSASKKASTNEGSLENGGSTKTNGNHHSGSEESSDEEDVEEDQTSVKVMKCLPVPSVLLSQTSAS